jgi:predicted amidohydrolase
MSSPSVPLLRVASIPLVSHRGTNLNDVVRVTDSLALAARQKISLVVFPETCMAGYGRSAKLRRAELEALAEPLDGPSIRAVADAVERTGVAAGVGLVERAPDGRIFNSYVVCLPGGQRHCHRKLNAVGNRWICSGDSFTVFDTPWGIRVGILIGSDNYLIENVRMNALMGATLLLAPHRSDGAHHVGDNWAQPVLAEHALRRDSGGNSVDTKVDTWSEWLQRWLPARAGDNGMFVVFSDGAAVTNHELPAGTGMIVDPYGRVLAGSGNSGESIISAGLDIGLIDKSAGRQWLKARRPDLYAPMTWPVHHAISAEANRVTSKGSIALSFAQIGRNPLAG